MAKITRKTARIFGSSALAAPNGISQFGSLAAGAPAYSLDPAVIQALSEWVGGWNTALVGGASPALEDMNAINYVNSYMVAYLLQQGIPEWDTNTVYYQDSFVSYNGAVWRSVTNDNIGNTPGSTTDWATFNSVYPVVTDTGSADDIQVTIPNFAGLQNGQVLFIYPFASNTGTIQPTVTINGGTPISVNTANGTQPVLGQILAGTLMALVYDGSALVLFMKETPLLLTAAPAGPVENDWDPSGLNARTRMIEITPSGSINITGLVPKNYGQPITLINLHATNTITIIHNSGSSAAGNRILLPQISAAETLTQYESIELIHNGSVWYTNSLTKA